MGLKRVTFGSIRQRNQFSSIGSIWACDFSCWFWTLMVLPHGVIVI